MAGDWIKMEVTTADKPEVAMMAHKLKCEPDLVVGKLFRIWVWANQNSVDGNAVTVTEAFLDRIAHRKGFASAMRTAGWLSGANGALCFPGFERHNGKTAKARAMGNRRVAKHRNGNDDVTPRPLQKALPEKRREENTSILTNRSKCTLEEAMGFAVELGLPSADGEACFQRWEGNGWKNGSNRIRDWKATMRSWKASGYMPSQKMNGAAKPAGRPLDLGGRKPAAILEVPVATSGKPGRYEELDF